MELNINDLGALQEAVFDARSKWYTIGLMLKVPVGTLDSIKSEYSDPLDQLRETLKAWLKTTRQPAWQAVADTLRSCAVGEPKLSSDIQTKYCQSTQTEVQILQQKLYLQEQQHQEATEADQRVIQQLTHQMEEKQQIIEDRERQLRQLNHQLLENQEVAAKLQQSLTQHEQIIQDLQHTIFRIKQEQEEAVAEKQLAIEVRDRQLLELNHQLQRIQKTSAKPSQKLMEQKQDLSWQQCNTAPEKMFRGTAVSDGSMAYFNDSGSTRIRSYDSRKQQWSTLPDCLYTHTSLVIIEHMLTGTAVGGELGAEPTNSLLSLTAGMCWGWKWSAQFPPMPTRRSSPIAVCSGHALIAAGGYDSCALSTVEILNVYTQQWSTASSLPHPTSYATAALCEDELYVMGGLNVNDQATLSVLTCSVPELLQSCHLHQRDNRPELATQSTVWQQIPDSPYYNSTCATLCGRLIIIGGEDEAGKETAAIHTYDSKTDSWEAVNNMPTARYFALVAEVSGKKLMVVGGECKFTGKLDTVEIAKIVL